MLVDHSVERLRGFAARVAALDDISLHPLP